MPSTSLNQFASNVLSFSSEYSPGNPNWSARNVCGPPRCNNVFADNVLAWCPANFNNDAIIEVEYEQAVFLTGLKIYENLNGGSVVLIEAWNGHAYVAVYSREAPTHITTYNVFEPEQLAQTIFRTKRLRLTLRMTAANYFSELDAIEMIGVLRKTEVPESTLPNDMRAMLKNSDSRTHDLEVHVDGQRILAHKCIVAARCPALYEHIEIGNGSYHLLNYAEFAFVLDFIYADTLNEQLLREAIEHNKPDLLTVNKLVRFADKYNLLRLKHLLFDFMRAGYLTKDNVLPIVSDALKDETAEKATQQQQQGPDVPESLETVCYEFLKVHLAELVHTEAFQALERHVLVKIMQNYVEY